MSRAHYSIVFGQLLATAASLVACEVQAPTCSVVEQRLPGSTLLSELVADPPGSDGPWEFVEVLGPPGNALDGYSLFFVDGDAESNPGSIDRIIDLGSPCDGGCRLGSNGIALLTSVSGHPSLDAATTIVPGLTSVSLENGSLSLLLTECDEPPTPVDLDPNDTGMLELPPGCTLVDAVAWTDGDSGDSAYGARISDQDPGAATRSGGLLGSLDAAAWVSGKLAGEPDSLVYSGASCPVLTPGAPNPSCEADSGASSGVAGATLRATGTAGSAASGGVDTPGDSPVRGTASSAGSRSGWDSSLVHGGASPRGSTAGADAGATAPPRPSAPSACRLTLPHPSPLTYALPPLWLPLLLLARRRERRRAASLTAESAWPVSSGQSQNQRKPRD